LEKSSKDPGLLDAIVNPSAGMAFGYEMWLVTKKDGTTASGFLQADGKTVVLKGMDGEVYNKEPPMLLPENNSRPVLCREQ
jgi:hypothetical protein